MQLTPEPVSAWYDLILDGQLMEDNLKASGRSVSWLESQLHSVGIGQKKRGILRGLQPAGHILRLPRRVSKRAEARSFDLFVLGDVAQII